MNDEDLIFDYDLHEDKELHFFQKFVKPTRLEKGLNYETFPEKNDCGEKIFGICYYRERCYFLARNGIGFFTMNNFNRVSFRDFIPCDIHRELQIEKFTYNRMIEIEGSICYFDEDLVIILDTNTKKFKKIKIPDLNLMTVACGRYQNFYLVSNGSFIFIVDVKKAKIEKKIAIKGHTSTLTELGDFILFNDDDQMFKLDPKTEEIKLWEEFSKHWHSAPVHTLPFQNHFIFTSRSDSGNEILLMDLLQNEITWKSSINCFDGIYKVPYKPNYFVYFNQERFQEGFIYIRCLSDSNDIFEIDFVRDVCDSMVYSKSDEEIEEEDEDDEEIVSVIKWIHFLEDGRVIIYLNDVIYCIQLEESFFLEKMRYDMKNKDILRDIHFHFEGTAKITESPPLKKIKKERIKEKEFY